MLHAGLGKCRMHTIHWGSMHGTLWSFAVYIYICTHLSAIPPMRCWNHLLFQLPVRGYFPVQRSQHARGGTVWPQQMPANRDQLLSWQFAVRLSGFSASGQFASVELIRPQSRYVDDWTVSNSCSFWWRAPYIRFQGLLPSISAQCQSKI